MESPNANNIIINNNNSNVLPNFFNLYRFMDVIEIKVWLNLAHD